MRARYRANVLLALFCLGMAGVIGVEWLHPPPLVQPLTVKPTKPPPVSSEQPVASFKIAPLSEYAEIIERPLFYTSRRPEEPEVAEAPAPAPPPEEVALTLIGVLVTPQSTTALVQNDETGKVSMLKAGDAVENWQLETIKADSVVLRQGETAKDLPLVRNKRKPTATPKGQEQQLARQLRRAQRLQQLQQQGAPLPQGAQQGMPGQIEGQDIPNQEAEQPLPADGTNNPGAIGVGGAGQPAPVVPAPANQ
ncbi:MAG: type II secretion system protein N [Gammaproteobacteria bacterium]